MPSMKDPTTRYATVLISIISVWIYVAIVNELLEIFEIPVYRQGVILLILVAVAHGLLLKSGVDKAKLDKAGSNPRTFFKIFMGTIVGVVVAVVLAIATTALMDSDYRNEVVSPFVTCARDNSRIKSIPVGKSTALPNGAELTVQNVAYDIPQRSERPKETNSWRCAKATAIEVSVQNIPETNSKDAISTSDLKLMATPPHDPTKSSLIGSESTDELYQTNLLEIGSLPSLKLKFLPEGATSSRGWLFYSVANTTDNKSPQLVYTKSGKSLVTIQLPE